MIDVGVKVKTLTKADIVLIASIFILSIVLILPSFWHKDDDLTAVITVNGEQVNSVKLKDITQGYDYSVNGTVIRFEKDYAAFVDSTCKDKICVNGGKLTKSGDTSACLPNGVAVTLKGEKSSVDAITY